MTAQGKREAKIVQYAQAEAAPEVHIETLTHVRNIHNGPVRVRLHNEEKDTSRNVRLSARGQRGDIARVSDAERQSSDYISNLFVLFEPISQSQADAIMTAQTHNQQTVHPALSGLTNENGQNMSQTELIVEPEYNKEQSFVVATEKKSADGRFEKERTVIERVLGPPRAALPGTENRPAESYVRDNIDPRVREMQADEAARRKGSDVNLADALQGFRVMDPAQRHPNVPVRGAETVVVDAS